MDFFFRLCPLSPHLFQLLLLPGVALVGLDPAILGLPLVHHRVAKLGVVLGVCVFLGVWEAVREQSNFTLGA